MGARAADAGAFCRLAARASERPLLISSSDSGFLGYIPAAATARVASQQARTAAGGAGAGIVTTVYLLGPSTGARQGERRERCQ